MSTGFYQIGKKRSIVIQKSLQLSQSSESSCADRYCIENKQIIIILLCTIILDFPDEVPMGNIFLQKLHLSDMKGTLTMANSM